jgi:hypothetical protein
MNPRRKLPFSEFTNFSQLLATFAVDVEFQNVLWFTSNTAGRFFFVFTLMSAEGSRYNQRGYIEP